MINLLPVDYKEEIRFARRNTTLRKWIILSAISLVGVALIVLGGLLYMNQSIEDNTKQLDISKSAIETQKVGETQKQIESISANTKLALDVLSREILFSQLLKQIGSALPSNTALKSLQIDSTQGGIVLNAQALDFNSATQLQVNLQDPKNGVFEKADINDITCDTGEDADSASRNSLYPCDVNVRALFGKNSSYYYIAPTEVKR